MPDGDKRFVDLHVHSTASDGTVPPGEIPALAAAAGCSAVALTDHNTVKGLPAFLRAAADCGIEALPGCELTTENDGVELHLLALFLPEHSWDALEAYVAEMNANKAERNEECLRRLEAAGYAIDRTELLERYSTGQVNRSNIARYLIDHGVEGTPGKIIGTMLRPGAGFYPAGPVIRLPFLECISVVRSWGALPVWAHPLLNLDAEAVAKLLPWAADAGLAGMEAFYSEYDAASTRLSIKLAQDNGLIPSGGSDYHGSGKADLHIGTGRGDLFVPYESYLSLKAELRSS